MRTLRDEYNQQMGRLALLREQLAESNLADLESDREFYKKAELTLDEASKNSREYSSKQISAITTSAMQDIFGPSAGCELAFKALPAGGFRPCFTVWDAKGVKADPMDGTGGSAAQVIGIALRIYFLLKTKQPRFLFLDEPFDGIDVVNVEAVAAWLKRICESLSIQLVIISHLGQGIFEQVADSILTVERNGNESVIAS